MPQSMVNHQLLACHEVGLMKHPIKYTHRILEKKIKRIFKFFFCFMNYLDYAQL